jgi:phosphatidylserine/phosphatidylglycerophosphate/cardiolipin synthase-like enzyme
MPTLAQLKSKWFIDVTAPGGFPPRSRLPGTIIQPSTDGNRVTPLLDGQNFMARWYDSIQQMILDQPATCDVWLTGWRLEDVSTLGVRDPTSKALEVLANARTAGVTIYGLLSNHMPGMTFNLPSILWLGQNGISNVMFDNRFPPAGSGHQKMSCMRKPSNPHALLGSIDISKTRWDTQQHLPTDDNRDSTYGAPTHDTGVMIAGPAAADLEVTFRERWNDPTYLTLDRNIKPVKVPANIGSPISTPAVAGSHSVQVLRTYALNTVSSWKYSWSNVGEFTVWASYLNALAQATQYIYIEDQYFLPFGWPPYCKSPTSGRTRDTDLIYQLGEAIKRGVKVLVVTPSNAEDSTHFFQKFQRDVGIEYLKAVAAGVSNGGDFVVASLVNATTPVYVHSKLMIVDDEFVLIGSANVGRRSMTFDSEVQVGIVDEAEVLAKEFRKSLWAEHLQTSPGSVDNVTVAYQAFKLASTTTPTGHVEPYPFEIPTNPPRMHEVAITKFIEPYGGPPL